MTKKEALAKRSLKKHTARRKVRRLQAAGERANLAPKRRKPPVSVIQCELRAALGGTVIVFGSRVGKYGHPSTAAVKLRDLDLVGAIEDRSEAGNLISKFGLSVLAAALRYDLSMQTEEGDHIDGLLARFASWAGIDVRALQKAAAEAELAEQAKATADAIEAGDPVDELGGEA